jgi:hypothetical protein
MKLLIILYLGTLERIMKGLGTSKDKEETRGASKSRWRPKSSQSRPSRTPGPACTKFVAQATKGFRFQ